MVKIQSVVFVSLSLLAVAGCNKKSKQSGGAPVGAQSPAAPAPAAGPVATAPSGESPSTAPATPAPAATPESSNQVPESSALFQDCETAKSSPFVADLVRIPEETQKLPRFEDLKVIRQICLNQLSITPRDFRGGFPGVTDLEQWFALNIKFNLKISKAGKYKFRLNSDDGSRLFVDGGELIDNDGRHSPRARETEINMTAGTHEMNVRYFQGPAPEIALELQWQAPGDSKWIYIPKENLSRP